MRMDQLPNDVETLKRLVIEQASALYSERLLVEKLKLQIARLRRMQFGSSSERHGERIAQLELLVEALESNLPPLETAPTPTAADKVWRDNLDERRATIKLRRSVAAL